MNAAFAFGQPLQQLPDGVFIDFRVGFGVLGGRGVDKYGEQYDDPTSWSVHCLLLESLFTSFISAGVISMGSFQWVACLAWQLSIDLQYLEPLWHLGRVDKSNRAG